MAIILSSTELFGLDSIKQSSLQKVITYIEEAQTGGATSFPIIPFTMFYGFELEEARSLTAMLQWVWDNPNSTVSVPGYLLSYGLGDGELLALTKVSQTLQEAGIGGAINLMPNGTFDDSVGWSLGASTTVSGGTLNIDAISNQSNTYDLVSLGLAAGTYRVDWGLVSHTNGNFSIQFTSTNEGTLLGATQVAVGNYSDEFVVTSSPTELRARITVSGGTAVGSMDNIKLYKIA